MWYIDYQYDPGGAIHNTFIFALLGGQAQTHENRVLMDGSTFFRLLYHAFETEVLKKKGLFLMNKKMIKSPLNMTSSEIDELLGKKVIISGRKPDNIEGEVCKIHSCYDGTKRCGITLQNENGDTDLSFGAMDSITVIME